MILFFVRRFNDIDHIVPIVYRLAKDGYKNNIAMLILNPDFDFADDFRLKFLKDEFGVEIDYVYRFYTPTLRHRFLSRFICSSGNKGTGLVDIFFKKINSLCKSIMKERYIDLILYKFVFKRNFGDEWAYGMLKSKNVSLLVFDWQKIGRYVTSGLINAATRLNIVKIAVPHGVTLFANDDWSLALFHKKAPKEYGTAWEDFDKIIVQFEHYKQAVIRGGVPAEKLHVLGSARFCREWEDIYHKIIPRSNSNEKSSVPGRIKVVFMDHSYKYRINIDAVLDTIKRLLCLDFVDFVIKPSTGSHKAMTSDKLFKLASVDTTSSSVELIEQADVVMGTTSSILLETMIMGKIFLYPKYFHENRMLWEDSGACWIVESYDKLEAALQEIASNPGYKPYSDDSVKNFINEIVYGGVEDRDVLGDYEKFILSFL